MKVKVLALATSLALMTSHGVHAAGTIGFVDLTFGLSKAENTSDAEDENAGFGSVSGAVALPVGTRGTVVIEGEIKKDTHDGDLVDGNDMKTNGQLGGHYLHDFRGHKFGAFLAYADANHKGDNEHYNALFGGIEGVANLSPAFTLYSQLGIGDRRDDNQSSQGFDNGKFVRIGAAYSGFAQTLLKLDTEYGETDSYEDEQESGLFWKLSLAGETLIPVVKGLTVTYGVSHGKYDAKADPDIIKETSFHVGVRYYFGGTTSVTALKSGLIGLPSIPLRSMAWVPALD